MFLRYLFQRLSQGRRVVLAGLALVTVFVCAARSQEKQGSSDQKDAKPAESKQESANQDSDKQEAAKQNGSGKKSKSDPSAPLKDLGLKTVSGFAVLEDESKVSKMLKEVPAFRKKLMAANKELAQAEATVAERDALLQQSIAERRQLNIQLGNAQSVQENNRIVAAINEITDRIELLNNNEQLEKYHRECRATANQLREEYVEHVLEARKIHDEVLQKYKDLAADKVVADEIEKFNKTAKKPIALGPSRSFLATNKALKKIEDTVLSEKIPLARSPGGVFMVSVVVNGSDPVEFVLDTGAGILSIPSKVAEQIGLDVPSAAPVIRLQIADGSVIEGRLVYAKSVRVGKFTVENVECAVLPPEAVNAEPLLGQSFLGKFSYKVDSDTAVLNMTKVEGETDPQATKGKKTNKKGKK